MSDTGLLEDAAEPRGRARPRAKSGSRRLQLGAAHPAPVERTPRRRLHLVALGCGLVLACAVAGGEIAMRASRLQSYLGLRLPLAAGQPLRAADLSRLPMRVSDGVGAIPLGAVGSYLGKVAASDLPVGSVLVPGDFLAGPRLRRMAIVGADLQSDEVPSSLGPGDPVWAVAVRQGAQAGSVAQSGVLLARGTVLSVSGGGGGAASGGLAVDLEVPLRLGPAVAGASAAGSLSLIEVPAGSGRSPAA